MKLKYSKADELDNRMYPLIPVYASTSAVPAELKDQANTDSPFKLTVLCSDATTGANTINCWDGASWSVHGSSGYRVPFNGGSTASRPNNPQAYEPYYDTTLGKAIIYNGSAWLNMDGTSLA